MADDVTVVFTRDQADLVQVLLDDPHLSAYDDAVKDAARGARDAVRAGLNAHMPGEEEDDGEAIQRAEMRAETFAAEAIMGMRAGTTEGWHDEPEPPDPYDEPEELASWEAMMEGRAEDR